VPTISFRARPFGCGETGLARGGDCALGNGARPACCDRSRYVVSPPMQLLRHYQNTVPCVDTKVNGCIGIFAAAGRRQACDTTGLTIASDGCTIFAMKNPDESDRSKNGLLHHTPQSEVAIELSATDGCSYQSTSAIGRALYRLAPYTWRGPARYPGRKVVWAAIVQARVESIYNVISGRRNPSPVFLDRIIAALEARADGDLAVVAELRELRVAAVERDTVPRGWQVVRQRDPIDSRFGPRSGRAHDRPRLK